MLVIIAGILYPLAAIAGLLGIFWRLWDRHSIAAGGLLIFALVVIIIAEIIL